ncbi:hypothetical protein GHK62_33205 [Sinorhizobium terangae]|uniref:Uncharacterized protein n=2 Tax=Sinorhizobium terangae TaxID=110322 RepID=A0A6N7LR43_SINTE|nr:hypothetical protein [Sinorhizobium terangae]MQX19388.1 hypothetical protein [Sinorhizobium terangae]
MGLKSPEDRRQELIRLREKCRRSQSMNDLQSAFEEFLTIIIDERSEEIERFENII